MLARTGVIYFAMDNTTPNQPQNPNYQQNPQNPQYPPYQPPAPGYGQQPYGQPTPSFGQQPPAGGNGVVARVNAFRRQRPILAGVAALIALCVVCAACGGIVQAINGGGSAAGSPTQASAPTSGPTATPAPTATNTPTPKWTTVQTFTGNGIKKTQTFTVPDDWKLFWSCKPSSFYGGSYNVIVTVYNSDGSVSDLAVNTICKSGNTGDSTEEHSGGQIYLDVNSEGYWQLQVQEQK
jgi:hypothetical protein